MSVIERLEQEQVSAYYDTEAAIAYRKTRPKPLDLSMGM
jgi:hypothetical protein